MSPGPVMGRAVQSHTSEPLKYLLNPRVWSVHDRQLKIDGKCMLYISHYQYYLVPQGTIWGSIKRQTPCVITGILYSVTSASCLTGTSS